MPLATSKPYAIEHSDLLGRYLVASRDISAGEVIMKETPLLVGPTVDSDPVCLGCYTPLPVLHKYRCSRCLVASLCSIVCEKCGDHGLIECDALRRGAEAYRGSLNITGNYQAILPLRCLLLRHSAPEKWASLMTLEAHMKERRDTPIWRRHQEAVVQVLRSWHVLPPADVTDASNAGKTDAEDADTDDVVQRLCGILDVNSFEIRGPLPCGAPARGPEILRAVYLEAALMAHDCIGNTHLAVDNVFQMTIHASVAIPAGQPIYFNYTSTLQGTDIRREHLREGKYFDCHCRRCADPTELSTHMSTVLCTHCPTGLVTHTAPDLWTCGDCAHPHKPAHIRSSIAEALQLIDDIDRGNPREMETLLKKLSRVFHPNHAVLLELRQCLVALYRDIILREPTPSRKMLQRKIELCRELLPVVGVIEPGISRLRGITLYELHVPMVLLANREYQSGDVTSHELLSRLREAEGCLREAVTQLVYEPTHTPEGQLAHVAMQELRGLRQNLKDVEGVERAEQNSREGMKGQRKRNNYKKSK